MSHVDSKALDLALTVDERHGKWMDSLVRDTLEASNILKQLKTRRDEIMTAAKASSIPDEREVGDQFARTAKDSIAVVEPGVNARLALPVGGSHMFLATATNSPACTVGANSQFKQHKLRSARGRKPYQNRTNLESQRQTRSGSASVRDPRAVRRPGPRDPTSPHPLPVTRQFGGQRSDPRVGLLQHEQTYVSYTDAPARSNEASLSAGSDIESQGHLDNSETSGHSHLRSAKFMMVRSPE